MRLVICDDHRVFSESLEIVFRDLGHEVCALTTDPDRTVDVVAEHRPDVCILDVSFPGGSSLAAISRIRSASPETKIVMLTADSSDTTVAKAIGLGASGYVRKERMLHDVVDAVTLAVEGHLAVEPALLQRALRVGQPSEDPLWPLSFLTDREWQVLRCIVDGMNTQEIAADLRVRRSTARTHVQNVLTKLGVHSRLQAMAFMSAHTTDDVWPAHVR